MTVVAHHHRTQKHIVTLEPQDRGSRAFQSALEICCRVIPRPRQSGLGPESNGGRTILTDELDYFHRAIVIGESHSLLQAEPKHDF